MAGKNSLKEMPDHAKVWIYQSKEAIPDRKIQDVQKVIDDFCQTWQSHYKPVHAAGQLVDGHFIVLSVDEQRSGVSGCSIDSSVAMIRALQQELDRDFFSRLDIAYLEGEIIRWTHVSEVSENILESKLSANSIVFDNTVQTIGEWRSHWKRPLVDTWLERYL